MGIPMTSWTRRVARALGVAALLFGAAGALGADAPGTIDTVAGGGNGDGGAATFAPLAYLSAVAEDGSGNLFIADYAHHRIRKVATNGTITTVAGNGTLGYSGDGGAATSATLNNPSDVAVDGSGNLFIADLDNARIRKVAANGTITTVAGNGTAGFSGDGGAATSAALRKPSGVAVDGSGNLFIADSFNHCIRKVATNGTITTVAGNGTAGFSGDGGAATSATLKEPSGVAVDGSGNLLIADSRNARIRKVATNGTITTVAGNGNFGFSGDGGAATSATLWNPRGVAGDGSGNVFITDVVNNRIRKVATNGTITTVAGNGSSGYSGDGGAAASAGMDPADVAVDGSGNLFIADQNNYRVRKVATNGTVTTVAGNGSFGFFGDGGAATAATLHNPADVAVDGYGNRFIADTDNHRIRRVATNGTITTVAGNGNSGFSGDGGAATSASLSAPYGVAVDGSGNLFIADFFNNRIRKVATSGTITSVAGNGSNGHSGDGGAATSATLYQPHGVAVDGSGNLYIADSFNHRIRKVATNGTITTVAGNGSSGYSGDGGTATSARLNEPSGVAVDGSGNLFIADKDNSRIRKVATSGTITTVAGNGSSGYSGDGGAATSAMLYRPFRVAVDASGNLFIADSYNQRIRKVATNGTITTVAGNGTAGFSDNGGAATSATLRDPWGVAVDGSGDLFIADTANHRIRRVTAVAALPLTVTATAADKVYDRTTAATVTLLSNKAAGDTVTISFTSATFANASVGTGKLVTVSGVSISGADAGKYYLANTSATDTADIARKTLIVEATGVGKVFDGGTTATATLALTGVVAPDVVTASGTAAFVSRSAGTGKTIQVTGISLGGADVGNYVLSSTSATASADITPKTVTVTATGVSKVFDGGTTATATLALTGVVAPDVVTASGTAAFVNRSAGTGKSIQVTGIALGDADAGNYTLNGVTTAATTADITPKTVTFTATGATRVYDGDTTATATLALTGVLAPDVVTASGTAAFQTRTAGTGKAMDLTGISLGGADAGNYSLNGVTTAATTADITPKTVTVTATGVSRVYDGDTTATATLALTSVVAPDVVTASGTAAFQTRTAGAGKAMDVTGISLGGADEGNYTLSGVTTAATSADITPKTVTATATGVGKVYDGDTTATATLGLTGVVTPDVVTASGTAAFADENVGIAKPVTVTGIALGDADAGNYTLVGATAAATTADITRRGLTVSITASGKVYDATTAATATLASDMVAGDDLTFTSSPATFADAFVGNAKTVTATGISLGGADAGNYVLTSTSATASADITPKTVTVTATGVSRVFDGGTTATATLALTGVVAPDVVTVSGTAAFQTRTAGAGKAMDVTGIALGGADAGNYTLNGGTTAAATADITQKSVTATATGVSRVYDGDTTATATLALTGVVAPDDVTASGTAAFQTRTAGTGKAMDVTGISLGGADAGNYTLNGVTTAATIADITQKTVIATATGVGRVYDGSTTATATLALAGIVAPDDVTASGTAEFSDKTVGVAKPVTVTGILLGGADAGNYMLTSTSATASADITQKTVTVSATGVGKVYDSDTTATATLALAGVVAPDDVMASGTAAFQTRIAGAGKAMDVTGISLGGADAGNYTLDGVTTAATSADISQKTVAVTATGVSRVYDGNTTATVTLAITGVVTPDVVTASGTAAFVSRSAGTGNTIQVTGISLAGADAGNYTLNGVTTATTTADITQKSVTATATGVSRVFDGTTTATATLALTGVVTPDVVTASGTAAFQTRTAGAGKAMDVTGISLGGTDAGNYVLTSTTATAAADITPKTVTATATGVSRVYDGDTAATATLALTGVVAPDVVTATGTAAFQTRAAGAGKAMEVTGISLGGADAGNYMLASTTATATADITPKTVTATATGVSRVYDGDTTATATLALAGIVAPDDVTVSGTAAFVSGSAGTGKTILVTGISLGGADVGNYTLDGVTTATAAADITPKTVTVTATGVNRVYDGSTTATATLALTGVLAPDVVTASGTAAFPDKHVGIAKPVTVTAISLDGADAGNYTLDGETAATTTADITRRGLTVSIIASDKIHDATTAATATLASDMVAGDDLTFTSNPATFANAYVGRAKTVTATGIAVAGADVTNYTLLNTTATTTADITPIFELEAADHLYDVAAPGTSLLAGRTRYLIPGDWDGDGLPDVVNVTDRGAQVFRNRGMVAGRLSLEPVQDLEVPYSYGGGAADVDLDGDLDLVLGDFNTVRIAVNDGHGLFQLTTAHTHNLHDLSLAVPFHTKADPLDPEDEVRIVVGPASDGLAAAFVLRQSSPGTWSVHATLDQFAVDGFRPFDADGDGDTDLLACNRTGHTTSTPFYLYADNGSGYAPVGGFDPALGPTGFSTGPADPVAGRSFFQDVTYGGFVVGEWMRFFVYPGNGSGGFLAPTWTSLDPNGAGNWARTAVAASALTDIDGNGSADLVVSGDGTPLLLYRLGNDLADPANRHATALLPGTTADLKIRDWDADASNAPDVLVGRSDGLWFHHNPNGGAAGTGTPETPPLPRASAWYRLDETTGTVAADASGSVPPHDGTIVGATPGRGIRGGARRFDGIDDHVEVPVLNDGAAFPAFTVEAWVKLDTVAPAEQVVVHLDGSDGGVLFSATGSDLVLTIDRDPGPSPASATAPSALVPGRWTHVAGTWDGTTLRVYVDGSLVASAAAPGALFAGPTANAIGRSASTGLAALKGTIDEVRIHGRALTAGELDWHVTAPATPGSEIREARDLLYVALDPAAANPITADTPTYTNAHGGLSYLDPVPGSLAVALSEIAGIDPRYLDETPNFVFGATAPDQVETLRRYWSAVTDAVTALNAAATRTTDADDLATIDAIIDHLLAAADGIVDQAHELGGVGAPFKRASTRATTRLRAQSLRDRSAMQQAIALARMTPDPVLRQRAFKRADRLGTRSLARLERYLRVFERPAGGR